MANKYMIFIFKIDEFMQFYMLCEMCAKNSHNKNKQVE